MSRRLYPSEYMEDDKGEYPPPHAPHPEMVWQVNKGPFHLNKDSLEFRNKYTYRSAAIRGDEQTVLHRVNIAGLRVPGDVNARALHQEFLLTNIPTMELGYGQHALRLEDPIFLEGQVAYNYSRYKPDPASKQEPLAYDGLDLTFIKDLGKGGFGIASLWEASFDDGHKMKVVIKRPLHKGWVTKAFEDERQWHHRYRKSENITQSLDLAQIAKTHQTNPPKKRVNSKGKYKDKNTLVLEYMEHDNLGQLNHNLAYIKSKTPQGKVWPNAALWRLFGCCKYP